MAEYSIFIWKPNFRSVTERIMFRTITSGFESGDTQTRPKWSLPMREWDLSFTKERFPDDSDGELEEINADALRDFYIARKGAYEPFIFKSPIDGEWYIVRFKDDTYNQDAIWNAKIVRTSITLVQAKRGTYEFEDTT